MQSGLRNDLIGVSNSHANFMPSTRPCYPQAPCISYLEFGREIVQTKFFRNASSHSSEKKNCSGLVSLP